MKVINLLLLLILSLTSQAQLLKKLKDKANQKVEETKNKAVNKVKDRVNNKEAQADNKVDGTMDKGLDKVEGVFKKKKKTTDTLPNEINENNENEPVADTILYTPETDVNNTEPAQKQATQADEKPKRKARTLDAEDILYSLPYSETSQSNSGELQFLPNKDIVAKTSFPLLQQIADKINNAQKEIKQPHFIKIIVYTSDTSEAAEKLSIKRAINLREYLVRYYKVNENKIYYIRKANNGEVNYTKPANENDKIVFTFEPIK